MNLSEWAQLADNSQVTEPVIYIGCMTGTSADRYADFTAALFDTTGMLQAYSNHALLIPDDLQQSLQQLSESDYRVADQAMIQQVEHQLTLFLAEAYHYFIVQLELASYPKDKIILSPHGQTIYHHPAAKKTCQLLDGPLLAKLTGYPVVHAHRQACIDVSNAAPLAPVLLKKLFYSDKQTTVVINGGGIANICVLNKEDPNHLVAYDTGPANGPVDALIRMIVNDPKLMSEIAPSLRAGILKHKYDVNGMLARSGMVNQRLYQKLMSHEYFKRPIHTKSVDLYTFGLDWITTAWNDELCSVADCVTTVAAVVADSISDALLMSLGFSNKNSITRVMTYGGLVYNSFIIERMRMNLSSSGYFEFISMESLGYNPDFIESLLMAYLGYCVYTQTVVDLSYMSKEKLAAVVPGKLFKVS